MNSDDRKNQIIKAAVDMKFYPAEQMSTSELDNYKKIPITEISGLGAMFSEMIPKLRTVTSTSIIDTHGLYRCSFPKGISGELAKFNDGTGNLGTIMNNGKIVGQARWNAVDSAKSIQSVVAPINPVDMFMAAAIIEMNHKLDKIEKLGHEILTYQKDKDKYEIEANFDALIKTYNNFKYNLDEQNWLRLKYNQVQGIKLNTAAKIKLLHSEIEKSMNKHDLIHNDQQTKQMVRNVQNDFQYYRMSVFMYSFATFLEVLLQGNFAEDYLKAVCDDIDQAALTYKEFYTECYNKLEHSSQTTLESKFLGGLAKVAGDAGNTIHKIPVIEQGPLDEALISAGESMKNMDKKKTETTLREFTDNMQSGARQFVDNIHEISRLYNDPMDVLIDNDYVYLKLT